jgi:hypothetical protein
MILRGDREWLDTVKSLPEGDLPCNVSTIAYAVQVAVRAIEAHDALAVVVDQLTTSILDDEANAMGLSA